MNYTTYLNSAQNLDFVPDEATADAMVKASLGIVASRLPDAAAREFTAALPQPLDHGTLRSHQERPTDIDVEVYLHDLSAQFGISREEARTAAATTLRLAKQDLGEDRTTTVQQQLPADWATFLEEA
jgi:uncharacterized protein (DUF2267 family)